MSEMSTSITVSGREIKIIRTYMPINTLVFYVDNPRIHSLIHSECSSIDPDQETIQETLANREHVKQLVFAIKKNGGLTDPLLVRGSDNVVLEGNSRLAAYRILEKKDPIKWGKVKCDVVQEKINNIDVATLLSSYHIIGRKSWDKFEQAGMFWRWKREDISKEEILERANSMGVSKKTVSHWIDVYSIMVECEDIVSSKWSYYDELWKSRDTKKLKAEKPELFTLIVKRVKNGDIEKADDVRKKLTKIIKHGKAPLERFAKGENSLEESFEEAEAGGATNSIYNKLNRFRKAICDPSCKAEILDAPLKIRQKNEFELKKIRTQIDHLLEKMKE
jgi:hypothetical protein